MLEEMLKERKERKRKREKVLKCKMCHTSIDFEKSYDRMQVKG